jgi:hypothetical protein
MEDGGHDRNTPLQPDGKVLRRPANACVLALFQRVGAVSLIIHSWQELIYFAVKHFTRWLDYR